ncbi:flagellar FlbD family protein [Lichenihabitans psoromatis]|uniref:flagellar FlbD family protein n=1 Tax=Lichenihabitans psoromatis TaxID=2528642 RepID=UPI001036CCC4
MIMLTDKNDIPIYINPSNIIYLRPNSHDEYKSTIITFVGKKNLVVKESHDIVAAKCPLIMRS